MIKATNETVELKGDVPMLMTQATAVLDALVDALEKNGMKDAHQFIMDTVVELFSVHKNKRDGKVKQMYMNIIKHSMMEGDEEDE